MDPDARAAIITISPENPIFPGAFITDRIIIRKSYE